MRLSSFVMTRRYRKACEKITLVFVCSGWKDWRWSSAHVSVGFLYIVLSSWPISLMYMLVSRKFMLFFEDVISNLIVGCILLIYL